MLYCQICKNKKEKRYCNFCGKNTNNSYVLKIKGVSFETRMPLIKMTHKRPGLRKFLGKVYMGWQDSGGKERNKHPKGVNKFMKIDRENNRYKEYITDYKTGEVIKDKEEPLNKHIPEKQQN